jgi:hypothetical protein
MGQSPPLMDEIKKRSLAFLSGLDVVAEGRE